MRKLLIKWWYKRKFLRAYRTLEKLYQRHRNAGHEVYFNAVNETSISLSCINCVELQPLKRKPGKEEVISVDSRGQRYRG